MFEVVYRTECNFSARVYHFNSLGTGISAPPLLTINKNCQSYRDALVDNDTGKLLNLTSAELDEISSDGNEIASGQRAKRDSFIEKRTCSSAFQLELFMIPIAIAMIPLALVSLLLCVCFCGPEDSRGHAPEKIMGVRLSQKRRPDDADENARKKSLRSLKPSASDDELEYHNGYIQRKDSKKTRFATNVLFIEPLRRASSVSCLEGMNSRRGSSVLTQQGPPTVHVGSEPFENAKFELEDGADKPKGLRKQTRFSDSVSVICEEDPLPRSAASKKRAKCMQRSISVA
uniref:ZP domain-containing protein n=1 Tax=Panagrellus redivivus TaxID=6233 RepID=A0A7E4URU1_PANRE